MHIEIRKRGSHVKYYLAHSYRESKKVYKFRKYLGQDIKSILLKERRIIAEKLILEEIHRYRIIEDPLNIELSRKEILQIKKLQTSIAPMVCHLSEIQWAEFSKVFTYNTNAIEGSRLNQKEVNELFEQDKWPDQSKEDIAEALGVNEAISYIRGTKEHISLPLIKKLHKIVFRNSKEFAGNYRKKGEEVVVIDSAGTVVHEGAPQARITHLLRELVEWYESNKSKYPGLVLAAVVHNQFENIHPFKDGNGRIGRILLNNILIKHRLPPINIGFANRMEYYDSLQEYEKYHNIKPTIKLFLKEYKALGKQICKHKAQMSDQKG